MAPLRRDVQRGPADRVRQTLATLALLYAAPVFAGLLRERYTYAISVNTAIKNEVDLGTSFVVDVVELPPTLGSNATALELVVSDAHVVRLVDGGRVRGKLPLDVQLAYAQPFFVLVGSSGGLQEVRRRIGSGRIGSGRPAPRAKSPRPAGRRCRPRRRARAPTAHWRGSGSRRSRRRARGT